MTNLDGEAPPKRRRGFSFITYCLLGRRVETPGVKQSRK